MDLKSILVAGIVFLILSEVVNTLIAVVTMSYYVNPAYFGVWSGLMMSTNGPPTIAFYIVSIIFSLITGIILAWAYALLKRSIPGKKSTRGFNYGLVLFLVAGVPFTLTTYLMFAVPAFLLFSWTVSSLIVYLLSGVAFSKLIK